MFGQAEAQSGRESSSPSIQSTGAGYGPTDRPMERTPGRGSNCTPGSEWRPTEETGRAEVMTKPAPRDQPDMLPIPPPHPLFAPSPSCMAPTASSHRPLPPTSYLPPCAVPTAPSHRDCHSYPRGHQGRKQQPGRGGRGIRGCRSRRWGKKVQAKGEEEERRAGEANTSFLANPPPTNLIAWDLSRIFLLISFCNKRGAQGAFRARITP